MRRIAEPSVRLKRLRTSGNGGPRLRCGVTVRGRRACAPLAKVAAVVRLEVETDDQNFEKRRVAL